MLHCIYYNISFIIFIIDITHYLSAFIDTCCFHLHIWDFFAFIWLLSFIYYAFHYFHTLLCRRYSLSTLSLRLLFIIFLCQYILAIYMLWLRWWAYFHAIITIRLSYYCSLLLFSLFLRFRYFLMMSFSFTILFSHYYFIMLALPLSIFWFLHDISFCYYFIFACFFTLFHYFIFIASFIDITFAISFAYFGFHWHFHYCLFSPLFIFHILYYLLIVVDSL